MIKTFFLTNLTKLTTKSVYVPDYMILTYCSINIKSNKYTYFKYQKYKLVSHIKPAKQLKYVNVTWMLNN